MTADPGPTTAAADTRVYCGPYASGVMFTGCRADYFAGTCAPGNECCSNFAAIKSMTRQQCFDLCSRSVERRNRDCFGVTFVCLSHNNPNGVCMVHLDRPDVEGNLTEASANANAQTYRVLPAGSECPNTWSVIPSQCGMPALPTSSSASATTTAAAPSASCRAEDDIIMVDSDIREETIVPPAGKLPCRIRMQGGSIATGGSLGASSGRLQIGGNDGTISPDLVIEIVGVTINLLSSAAVLKPVIEITNNPIRSVEVSDISGQARAPNAAWLGQRFLVVNGAVSGAIVVRDVLLHVISTLTPPAGAEILATLVEVSSSSTTAATPSITVERCFMSIGNALSPRNWPVVVNILRSSLQQASNVVVRDCIIRFAGSISDSAGKPLEAAIFQQTESALDCSEFVTTNNTIEFQRQVASSGSNFPHFFILLLFKGGALSSSGSIDVSRNAVRTGDDLYSFESARGVEFGIVMALGAITTTSSVLVRDNVVDIPRLRSTGDSAEGGQHFVYIAVFHDVNGSSLVVSNNSLSVRTLPSTAVRTSVAVEMGHMLLQFVASSTRAWANTALGITSTVTLGDVRIADNTLTSVVEEDPSTDRIDSYSASLVSIDENVCFNFSSGPHSGSSSGSFTIAANTMLLQSVSGKLRAGTFAILFVGDSPKCSGSPQFAVPLIITDVVMHMDIVDRGTSGPTALLFSEGVLLNLVAGLRIERVSLRHPVTGAPSRRVMNALGAFGNLFEINAVKITQALRLGESGVGGASAASLLVVDEVDWALDVGCSGCNTNNRIVIVRLLAVQNILVNPDATTTAGGDDDAFLRISACKLNVTVIDTPASFFANVLRVYTAVLPNPKSALAVAICNNQLLVAYSPAPGGAAQRNLPLSASLVSVFEKSFLLQNLDISSNKMGFHARSGAATAESYLVFFQPMGDSASASFAGGPRQITIAGNAFADPIPLHQPTVCVGAMLLPKQPTRFPALVTVSATVASAEHAVSQLICDEDLAAASQLGVIVGCNPAWLDFNVSDASRLAVDFINFTCATPTGTRTKALPSTPTATRLQLPPTRTITATLRVPTRFITPSATLHQTKSSSIPSSSASASPSHSLASHSASGSDTEHVLPRLFPAGALDTPGQISLGGSAALAMFSSPAQALGGARMMMALALADGCPAQKRFNGVSALFADELPLPLSLIPGFAVGGSYFIGALVSHVFLITAALLFSLVLGYVARSSFDKKKKEHREQQQRQERQERQQQQQQLGGEEEGDSSSISPRRRRRLRSSNNGRLDQLEQLPLFPKFAPVLNAVFSVLAFQLPFLGLLIGAVMASSKNSDSDNVNVTTSLTAVAVLLLILILGVGVAAFLLTLWIVLDIPGRPLVTRSTLFWPDDSSSLPAWRRALRRFLRDTVPRSVMIGHFAWQPPRRSALQLDGDGASSAPPQPPHAVLVQLGKILVRQRGPRLRSDGAEVDRCWRNVLSPFYMPCLFLGVAGLSVLQGAALAEGASDPALCDTARGALFAWAVLNFMATLTLRPQIVPLATILDLVIDLWSVALAAMALPGALSSETDPDKVKSITNALGVASSVVLLVALSRQAVEQGLLVLSGASVQKISIAAFRRHVESIMEQLDIAMRKRVKAASSSVPSRGNSAWQFEAALSPAHNSFEDDENMLQEQLLPTSTV